MKLGFVAGALGIVGICSGWLATVRGDPPVSAQGARVPVIVELFSSEGCSSCPPADAYLAELDRAQPIDGVTVIALEEHVDYWDRLGWRDPFGSAAFSERQSAYARVLSNHQVFTPEIGFDGHLVMPTGDKDAARAMMQAASREPKARVALRRDGSRVLVDVSEVASGGAGAGADDPAEVMLAITESGLVSAVEAGENAGRRLAHAPVVRRLRSLGRATGGSLHIETTLDTEPTWKVPALRVVVFVQRAKTRRIVGAAAL